MRSRYHCRWIPSSDISRKLPIYFSIIEICIQRLSRLQSHLTADHVFFSFSLFLFFFPLLFSLSLSLSFLPFYHLRTIRPLKNVRLTLDAIIEFSFETYNAHCLTKLSPMDNVENQKNPQKSTGSALDRRERGRLQKACVDQQTKKAIAISR